MRFVALILLSLSVLNSLRGATDRVHPDHVVRSVPRRSLLISIAAPAFPASPPPSWREVGAESAFDEEESNDLDPLDASSRVIGPRLLAGSRFEPFSTLSSPRPGPGGARSRPLRC